MGKTSAVVRAWMGSLIAAMVLASAPAGAQTTTTLTAAVTPPEAIDFGSTFTYSVTITNGGGNGATDVTLDSVTLPPAPHDAFKLKSVTGATCTKDAAGAIQFPCAVTSYLSSDPGPAPTDPKALRGNQVKVTITVDWPNPAATDPVTGQQEPPPIPPACPAATALGPFEAKVSAKNATQVAGTDDGSKTAVDPWADLSVDLAYDFAASNPKAGGTAVFHGTVTNRGPCPSDWVVVTFTPNDALKFVSGEGACPDANATLSDKKTPGCAPGAGPNQTLQPGQSVTFTHTFSIVQPTGSFVSSSPDYGIAVASAPLDPTTQTATPDPYSLDDSKTVPVTTDAAGSNRLKLSQDVSGCASGGSGSLFALVAVAAAVFGIRRRRRAA